MKPSERVIDIYNYLKENNPTVYGLEAVSETYITAILQYLDEQYEAEELVRQKLIKDLKPME